MGFNFGGGAPSDIEDQIVNQIRQQQRASLGTPKYSNDPNQFKGFDNSELGRQLAQNIQQKTARGQQAAAGQFAKANPYGASSSRNRAMGLIGAQGTRDTNLMQAGLARQTYEDQLGMMDRYNNQVRDAYNLEYGNIERAESRDEKERDRRQKMFSDILGAGSSMAGGYFGGK